MPTIKERYVLTRDNGPSNTWDMNVTEDGKVVKATAIAPRSTCTESDALEFIYSWVNGAYKFKTIEIYNRRGIFFYWKGE